MKELNIPLLQADRSKEKLYNLTGRIETKNCDKLNE